MPPKRRPAATKAANDAVPVKKPKKAEPVEELARDAVPVKRSKKAVLFEEIGTPKLPTRRPRAAKKLIEEPEPVTTVSKRKKETVPDAKNEKKTNATKETKPKKTSKKKAVNEKLEEDEEEEDEEEQQPEVKPKKAAPKSKKAPAKKAAPLNSTETGWESIDFGCTTKNANGETYNLKITSWNVDGLRACIKKGGWNIFSYDKPDILCLQETKCREDQLPEEERDVDGYHSYWCSSEKDGYAGVAVYSKTKPINVTYGIGDEGHDDEGRCITLEYTDFFLINVYVPNAGRGLVTLPKRLEWNELFKAYIKKLDKKKPVILCGDMNVAHNEIDLANPKTNKKNAGFTQEERDGMTDFLEDGYIDSFRELYPDDKDVYTFWSYMSKARSKNVGWRLDYFIVSTRIMDNVCDQTVRKEILGSDHCPISLFITIEPLD